MYVIYISVLRSDLLRGGGRCRSLYEVRCAVVHGSTLIVRRHHGLGLRHIAHIAEFQLSGLFQVPVMLHTTGLRRMSKDQGRP